MHCLAIFCTVIKFNVSPCTGLVHLSPKTAVRSNLSTFCFHELIHKDLASRANILLNHLKMLHFSKQKKSFSWKTQQSAQSFVSIEILELVRQKIKIIFLELFCAFFLTSLTGSLYAIVVLFRFSVSPALLRVLRQSLKIPCIVSMERRTISS